ncbi:hypothetical protein KP509_1Z185600 [Ceratopteris richardii]|nr:hypothetical protein KP509_1Z185600 [Ceratopteris richardii]
MLKKESLYSLCNSLHFLPFHGHQYFINIPHHPLLLLLLLLLLLPHPHHHRLLRFRHRLLPFHHHLLQLYLLSHLPLQHPLPLHLLLLQALYHKLHHLLLPNFSLPVHLPRQAPPFLNQLLLPSHPLRHPSYRLRKYLPHRLLPLQLHPPTPQRRLKYVPSPSIIIIPSLSYLFYASTYSILPLLMLPNFTFESRQQNIRIISL